MKITLAEISRIRNAGQLQAFLSRHRPVEYNEAVLKAISRKLHEIPGVAKSRRILGLYTLVSASYANLHPYKLRPKRGMPRARSPGSHMQRH